MLSTPANAPAVHLASPAVTGPSPQHLAQIAQARIAFKPIRRAAATATCSAWTMAIFGAITLLTSLNSITGAMLGAGMCAISFFEFNGAKEIRRLNPEAIRQLVRNQLVLGALLLIYSSITLYSTIVSPNEIEQTAQSTPEVAQILKPYGRIERLAEVGVCGAMIIAAVGGCGGTAWYYSRRRRHIERYLRESPQWIVELQRAGMTVC
jgi:hypothetical protein